MITLQKLAYQIIRLEGASLTSGLFTPDHLLDDSQLSTDQGLVLNYVIQFCRQAANSLLSPIIYKNINDDDRSTLPLVIASYEVSVQGTNPNKYIDLPEFYQSLPFNKGLYGIAPVKDRANHFIPRLNPAVSRSLPCSDLEPDQYSYFTEGLKVYFDEDMDLGKILVKLLVVAPDTIAATASLPIYPEMQVELIQMVRQMIQKQPLQTLATQRV